ncbi:hypothetical protein ACIRP2_39410 [Streptomyces sp. NPDC101194]|uniref:hypothetical protein n=1 Tax=Streptomyces sp. NPDC101194 TaxID=3366127 RepID=UPI0037F3BEFD
MRKIKSLAASMAAAAALTVGFASSAMAADQSAISIQSSKCSTVWTSNSKGSINVCWTWYKSASSNSYYGSFWGTFYDHAPTDGKWVILQAKWSGRDWTPIRTAANGGSFSGDYSGLNGLNFRACLTGGYCGSPAA